MCYTPVILKKTKDYQTIKDTYFTQQVPCGQCLECRRARQHSWYVRLNAELKNSYTAKFITLTYDDDNIPVNSEFYQTLYYEDVQLFFKRLRRRQERKHGKLSPKIKYFAVGEYGSQTNRPHYHIILFNCLDINDVEKSWKFGNIHAGDVTDQSIYYTLKYCLKSTLFDSTTDTDNTGRQREKALMSKGLGLSYLTPQMQKYFNEDLTRGVTLLGGQELPLPRYYRNKMWDSEQEKGKIYARNKLMSESVQYKQSDREENPLFELQVKDAYRRASHTIKKTD